MDMNIHHNVRQVERGLSDFARRQVPFATALMLNWTAEDVRKNAIKALKKRLDRPTRFTLNAFAIKRASKRRLWVRIFAKDRQAEYLAFAEGGGTRHPKKQAIVVPVRQRTNKHGNMPRGAIKRALAKPTVFSGRPKGGRPGGIYQRTKKGLRLLIDYAASAIYTPRLHFKRDARRTAEARTAHHFDRAIRRAIDTAK